MNKSIKNDLFLKNYRRIYLQLRNVKKRTEFEEQLFIISKQFFCEDIDKFKKEFLQILERIPSPEFQEEYLLFLIRKGDHEEFLNLVSTQFPSFKDKGSFLGEVTFELYSFINRFFKSSKDIFLFEKIVEKLNSFLFHTLK